MSVSDRTKEFLDVFVDVVKRLDTAGIKYMVSGSHGAILDKVWCFFPGGFKSCL